jgi:hypothetical protein
MVVKNKLKYNIMNRRSEFEEKLEDKVSLLLQTYIGIGEFTKTTDIDGSTLYFYYDISYHCYIESTYKEGEDYKDKDTKLALEITFENR